MTSHIFLLVMGVALLLIILRIRSKYKRLSKNGSVIGTIAGFEMVTKKNVTVPTPVIHFVTSREVVITGRSDDSILSSTIKEGTKVKVFYNPDNPEDFIAQGLKFNLMTITVLIVCIIFSLFGVISLLNDLNIVHLFKSNYN